MVVTRGLVTANSMWEGPSTSASVVEKRVHRSSVSDDGAVSIMDLIQVSLRVEDVVVDELVAELSLGVVLA